MEVICLMLETHFPLYCADRRGFPDGFCLTAFVAISNSTKYLVVLSTHVICSIKLNLNLSLFTVSKAKNKLKTLDIEEVKKMFRTWN
jgi:hypothetical protein